VTVVIRGQKLMAGIHGRETKAGNRKEKTDADLQSRDLRKGKRVT